MKVSNILNLNKSTVVSVAKRNNLKVNRDVVLKNMSKSIIDINDYVSVEKEEIAYILGLIWADGHVTFANNNSRTPIVKHSCVSYDSAISDNIFKYLKWRGFYSNNYKSLGKNEMSINWISSRELGNYLISENYRNKNNGTYIYKRFERLKSHFLRGFFDGDGCFTISKSGNKYKQISIYFSSTHDQDWKFITDILDDINVEYKYRICEDKLGKSSQISIKKTESIINLCNFMYKDSEGIRLERKYSKYQEFINYKKSFIKLKKEA
jgi:intein/homing endonuclease